MIAMLSLPPTIAGDEAERGADAEGEDHRQDADEQDSRPPRSAAPACRGRARPCPAGSRRADAAQAADHRALVGVLRAELRARAIAERKISSDAQRADHADLVARGRGGRRSPNSRGLGRLRGLRARLPRSAKRSRSSAQPRLMRGSIAVCTRSTRDSATRRTSPAPGSCPAAPAGRAGRSREFSRKPGARPGEHRLHQDRAAHQVAELQAHHRQRVRRGVLDHVAGTRRAVSPLARSATTNSWFRISPTSARTVRVTMPIGMTESVTVGSTRCFRCAPSPSPSRRSRPARRPWRAAS